MMKCIFNGPGFSIRCIVFFIIMICMTATAVQTQTLDYSRYFIRDNDDERDPGPADRTAERRSLIEQLHMESILEGYIDPDEYIMGPMDLLIINVAGEIPVSGETLVSPEGLAVLPMVGSVEVKGMTLREAKEEIYNKIRSQYRRGDISVSLLSPRTFSVHVSGVVKKPGMHPASAIHRVSNAVILAGIYNDETIDYRTGGREEEIRLSSSLRNIRVIRDGGDTLTADMYRYFITGDREYNPQLRDGDVIVVPPEDLHANSVSIYGGVRLPGRFEYREGDNLKLILQLSQGFTEDSVRDSIQVARFTDDGLEIEYHHVDGEAVLSGEDVFPLKRNDRIFVRKLQGVRREYTVTVQGEVNYTGSFSITRENTRLSEVIDWAGGFTGYASLSEAVVFRRNPGGIRGPAELPPNDPQLLRRLSPMRSDEMQYFNFEMQLQQNTVAVDFQRLFNSKDPSADVTLRDGDVIIVPSKMNTVYVFGQVVSPGHVSHIPGMDMDYYLARAGGTSEVSRDRKIKVIKAGTREWVDPGDTSIEPGDAIFIPRRPERGFSYYYNIFRDAIQLSTAAATIYLLILQISRN